MGNLVPVDMEAEVVGVLTPALGVPFSTQIPNPRPVEFGRVTTTGGGQVNMVTDQPRLMIECWAADSVRARAIAGQAYGQLLATYGSSDTWGGRASLTSPVNYPDPDVGPRYQFFATIIATMQEIS